MDFDTYNYLQALLSNWNNATNPSALRSDKEHIFFKSLAKVTMEEINEKFTRGVHYYESENTGKLLVKNFKDLKND